jgi:N-acetylglucosamine kinase-like BadF-type ATPase
VFYAFAAHISQELQVSRNMISSYFLGLDAGGTKTHALIADQTGKALGFAQGGPGNWQSVGFDKQRDVLKKITQQALNNAGLGVEQIAGAGLGIAGYDWPSQLQTHLDVIQELNLSCPFEITNDSVIGLLAGASQGWGVSLVAGTGNNCRGRDKNGREGRITGEGELFGEFGGGVEIVHKTIQAIAHEWSKRGPSTSLSKTFMDLTGSKDLFDFLEGIDLGRYEPKASWVLNVFEAARAGDQVACEIIAWAARELGESACAVIKQLDIETCEFEVVLAGSIFEGGDLYIRPLENTIHKLAPRARLVKLKAPPVVGGVVLGMQTAGLETAPVHKNLIESTKAYIVDL